MGVNERLPRTTKGTHRACRSSVADDEPPNTIALLIEGRTVALALMVPEDAGDCEVEPGPRIHGQYRHAGEAHSVEMPEFYQSTRPRNDNVEFAVVLRSNGRLVGFGGFHSRALTATYSWNWRTWSVGQGPGRRRVSLRYGFFFRNLHIKVEVLATINGDPPHERLRVRRPGAFAVSSC